MIAHRAILRKVIVLIEEIGLRLDSAALGFPVLGTLVAEGVEVGFRLLVHAIMISDKARNGNHFPTILRNRLGSLVGEDRPECVAKPR